MENEQPPREARRKNVFLFTESLGKSTNLEPGHRLEKCTISGTGRASQIEGSKTNLKSPKSWPEGNPFYFLLGGTLLIRLQH